MTWTQTSTYDAQGARNKLKISDGLNPADSLQFSVNVHNFPEYLPDFAGKWTRTYRGATTGLLDTIRFPTTGTASTDLRVLPGSFNAYGQPTSVLVKAGTSTLQNWRYEYDASGRITRVDTTLDTEHGYWSRQYTYDARGRLYSYRDVNYYPSDSTPVFDIDDENLIIGWEYSWGEYESHAVTYAPDYSGNRTDGSASYTNDRLTSMTGADGVAYSFTYDAEGRRLSKTALGYSQTYGWNDRGQLAWVKTNGDSVAFVYDAAGRRVEKHFATTTYYLWDGDNLVMDFNSLGTKRKYAYQPGLDHAVAVTINGTTYYYTLDEEGNVRGLWNSSNSESESYTYDPYGFLLSGGGSLNSLRWKGREFDSDVGMYYMRARWYDPVVGRFISEDPIGLTGGINPYAFAAGEPVNNSDPMGLRCVAGESEKIVYKQQDKDNWSSEKQCYRDGRWVTDLEHGYKSYSGHNFIAMMYALRNALNSVGDLTGINGLGEGAEDLQNGDHALGVLKIASNLPVLSGEASTARLAASQLRFQTAHAARHLVGTPLTSAVVEHAIRTTLVGKVVGSHHGWVQVGAHWIQYRAYLLADGIVNVGTYFPVVGPFGR